MVEQLEKGYGMVTNLAPCTGDGAPVAAEPQGSSTVHENHGARARMKLQKVGQHFT